MDTPNTLGSQPTPDISTLVHLYRAGNHALVWQGAQARLQQSPEDRDLLLIAAQSLRQLNRLDEAFGVLDRLERAQPRFSRLHHERGLCFLAYQDTPKAIDALSRAVSLNDNLLHSWQLLEDLYLASGDIGRAQDAARHSASLSAFPPAVINAASLHADGEVTAAESIVRSHISQNGTDPAALRLLARIAMERGLPEETERLLKAVLDVEPDNHMVRYDYAASLAHQNKYREVEAQAQKLLALNPTHKRYILLAAVAAMGLGDQKRSEVLCRTLFTDKPDSPDLCLWLGHALRTMGRTDEAVDIYRHAIRLRPDFGNAYWSLANLKTYRFTDLDIDRMRAAEAAGPVGQKDRVHLCFALGKALEDRKEYSAAWTYYERGNDLERSLGHYQAQDIEAGVQKLIDVCTRDLFDRRKGWGDPQPDPIFIVGLPRSGSTLLEQILASHSQVDGTQELTEVQGIVKELMGDDQRARSERYPAVLQYLSDGDFRRRGEKYLADTQVYRTGKPRFIDKMPNNFHHVGLIHLMLPNARIIDIRREPMACCFGNFKQLFAQGQKFTYSLEDIALYYRSYLRLMRHWDQVLPGRVLRVHHEDVVNDLEGSVRRILAYCKLDFEQSCLDFHKTKRNVRTPSSEQVRQPVSRDSLDQWKNFEPWLGPLRAVLGDALVTYRD